MEIPDFFTNKEKLLSYDFSLINNYLNTEIDNTYHIKNLSLEKELLVDYFKSILEVVEENQLSTKVFYPSTFAIRYKKKFKRIECYLLAKEMGEKICLKKKYRKIVKFFRLPQFISRSNYNIMGHFEGKSLNQFDKYLNLFFK